MANDIYGEVIRDLHVPLGDTIINKLKAYMLQWVLGPELLASFYSLSDQGDSFTDSCAQWFNYHVREKSNFNSQLIYAIDSDLQNGMGILKVYWDVDKNQIGFCSILPFYCVVPPTTEAT